jgi:hypothetical protein
VPIREHRHEPFSAFIAMPIGYRRTNLMLDFWGKTSSNQMGERTRHPLVWHCLDVAAVVELLLDLFPNLIVLLENASGAQPVAIRTLLVRLTLLHDIGKFAQGFQAKAPEFYPTSLGLLPDDLPLGDHTSIGLRLLLMEFAQELDAFVPGVGADARRPLLEAVWSMRSGGARPTCARRKSDSKPSTRRGRWSGLRRN